MCVISIEGPTAYTRRKAKDGGEACEEELSAPTAPNPLVNGFALKMCSPRGSGLDARPFASWTS